LFNFSSSPAPSFNLGVAPVVSEKKDEPEKLPASKVEEPESTPKEQKVVDEVAPDSFKSWAAPSSNLFNFSNAATATPLQFNFQTSFSFSFSNNPSTMSTVSSVVAPANSEVEAEYDDDGVEQTPATFEAPKTPLPPPPVLSTGEEEESHVFQARGKLFVLDPNSKTQPWKERGLGPLRLNVSREGNSARLLMRVEASGRLILNLSLFPSFRMERAGDRAVRFVGPTLDGSQLCTYLIKFGRVDGERLDELRAAVEEHKPKAKPGEADQPAAAKPDEVDEPAAKPDEVDQPAALLKRQNTMAVTAAEGERFVAEADARQRRKEEKEQKEDEAEPAHEARRLKRMGTMEATAAEGARFLKQQEEKEHKGE